MSRKEYTSSHFVPANRPISKHLLPYQFCLFSQLRNIFYMHITIIFKVLNAHRSTATGRRRRTDLLRIKCEMSYAILLPISWNSIEKRLRLLPVYSVLLVWLWFLLWWDLLSLKHQKKNLPIPTENALKHEIDYEYYKRALIQILDESHTLTHTQIMEYSWHYFSWIKWDSFIVFFPLFVSIQFVVEYHHKWTWLTWATSFSSTFNLCSKLRRNDSQLHRQSRARHIYYLSLRFAVANLCKIKKRLSLHFLHPGDEQAQFFLGIINWLL